ncbi:MAG TPA: GTP-binding protein, partial [Puia sp.]|nr:GTP-binding protein [Puia sp.]
MDLLRFITAGSVDDGKSTLIGRLLYDSKSILTDQLEALERQSRNKEDGEIDLALLTDGLRAEREQGITIDVAYKYFSTPRRKFIIADAPGHIQYTRNMVTGASNANLIIILIDARNGIVEQTRRHSVIASLLNIPHVVIAINKMDLVGYSRDRYNDILIDYAEIARSLQLKDVVYLPISALKGDNIVERSSNLS